MKRFSNNNIKTLFTQHRESTKPLNHETPVIQPNGREGEKSVLNTKGSFSKRPENINNISHGTKLMAYRRKSHMMRENTDQNSVCLEPDSNNIKQDKNIGKSSSLPASPSSNRILLISPFSRRKSKKSRSLFGGGGPDFTKSEEVMSNSVSSKRTTKFDKNITTKLSKIMKIFSGDTRKIEERRNELIAQGIYKNEAIFGNRLENLPLSRKSNHNNSSAPTIRQDIPEFIVRCVDMIETMISTSGLYRINGDAAVVQNIRYDVNNSNYKQLDKCKSVAILTSTLKLFLRELPSPLIERKLIDSCFTPDVGCPRKYNTTKLIKQMRNAINDLHPLTYNVLHYIFEHLKRVANNNENRMNARSLAIIFGQNLAYSNEMRTLKIDAVLAETEKSNKFVEMIIMHVDEVFLN